MARGNFGERLKRERELREVSLAEITSATRIGPRFLNALENEDWEKLPGGVFNRGFVRSIARYLGLDEEAFLAEYDMAHNAQVPPEPPKPEERIPSPPRWLPAALVAGALVLIAALILVGVYGWHHYRARRSPPPPPPTSSAPASSVPASNAPPPSTPGSSAPASSTPASFPADSSAPSSSPSSTGAPQNANSSEPTPSDTSVLAPISLDLAVSANAPSHVLVQADGYVVFDSDMEVGQTHHFFAMSAFQVSASHADAVLLQLNGQVIPSLGPPGSSGTIKLNRNDLRQASSGNPKP